MKNILEADGIFLEYRGLRILQDVYLKIGTGQVVGLFGRNGTGKSSLFKIIFGQLQSQSHSIRINEKPLKMNNRYYQNIKYLAQQNFIPKHLTVKRVLRDFNLDFSLLLHYFSEFQSNYRSRLSELSSGQRRIIEIFVILKSKSKFCLLDEPFSQVMPLHVEMIKAMILEERKNKGLCITDHLYKHVLDLSNPLYLIKSGKTYLLQEPNQLKELGYIR